MADFEVQVAVRIVLPFKAAVDPSLVPETTVNESGRIVLVDRQGHEEAAAKIEKQRGQAAKDAEHEINQIVKKMVGGQGKVIDVVIEELRDA